MIVDFHTHTFPDRIAPAAIRKLQQASRTAAFSDGSRVGLLDSMAHAGIDHSVVLPVVTNPQKAASMNDLSICLTGRDGLIYFGGIHPDTPNAQMELTRIAREGLKGIKVHPVYQGTDIDDIRYLRILDKAAELGLIVVMHAGEDIGFPGEIRCSPQMIASALLQVGPVRLVCAHMGGWRDWDKVIDCLAGTSAMIDTAFSLGELSLLEEGCHPGEQKKMLDESAFIGLIRAFGAERVLFGTDSPWADQAQSLALVRSLGLDPQEEQAILGGNACRLLGIPEHP